MSLDAPEENSVYASTDNETAPAKDHNFDHPLTEHIIIGDEFPDPADLPTIVRQREYLRNHVQRTITEITFYEEGFLKIREGDKKKLLKEHVIELRFIDSEPVTTRQIPLQILLLALALGFVSLLVFVLLPATTVAKYSVLATSVSASLAVLVFLAFIYRSKVSHQFCTASGKTDVVSLCGSPGCFRRAAFLAKQIQTAIEKACENTGEHDVRYLRAEMQAHYKLAETGVITREECSDGTALILSKFG